MFKGVCVGEGSAEKVSAGGCVLSVAAPSVGALRARLSCNSCLWLYVRSRWTYTLSYCLIPLSL